jgi:branched-chain amino acid transport system permease protein
VTLGLDRTVWILLIVILGGVGSLIGTVIGVVVALMFEVVVTRFTDRYLTVMGVTFLLLVLFAPNGIMGAVNSRLRRSRRGPGPGPERGAFDEPPPERPS